MSIDLPRPVGFVLGGGGSLGAAQAGMLSALTEAGVFPDLVVGTSVGAMNGAVVAYDPRTAASRLTHIWPSIRKEEVFPGGVRARIRTVRAGRTYLFESDSLYELIGRLLPCDTFEQLQLPFGAVVTEIETAAVVVLRAGLLRPALLASTAIPGVFPPVWQNGRTYYDGGIVSNVPMREAIGLGAKSLVVLDCGYPTRLPPPPDTMAGVLTFVSVVLLRQQAIHDLPLVTAQVPVLYLPGPPIRHVDPTNFSATLTLMSSAYEASRRFLDGVEIDGPGLYGSVQPVALEA